uniref:Uncharacterized protein n=1 Tax=Leptobrachium leishanense TaxID=445787 RepID=A0A8C5QEG1_9ANUR
MQKLVGQKEETSSSSLDEEVPPAPRKKRAQNMAFEEMLELVRIFDTKDYDCQKGPYRSKNNARKDRILDKLRATILEKFGKDRTKDQLRKHWSDLKVREQEQLRRIRRVIAKLMACDLREELNCAVCLNIYKDPVTLTCGHSFCQLCIENVLDTQQRCGAYSCPNCRAEFSERPALQRSTALCNIAECVHATSPDVGVLCSYCVNQSIPAVKTCLKCEAALCETHLQVHCKSAEHILKEPTTYQGNRKCTVHREVLKYICSHDRTFVCVSCYLAGDHRGHYVELLERASEKTKEKMKNVLMKLSANRSETEEDILNLQNHGKELLEQAASVGKRVTTLFRDIHAQLDTLEKRLHSELSSQEKRFSRRVSDQILKLEVKKEKLSERMCRIEELCNLTDPLMVLQERESSYRKFFEHEDSSTEEEEEEEEEEEGEAEAEAEEEEYERGPEDCSWEEDEDEEDEDEDDDEDSEDEWFDSVGGLDEGSIAMTLQKALPDIVNNELRDFYVRPAKGLLLDPKTAASSITISDD